MNIFVLVWSYLKARPLNTALNIVLLSLGIGVIAVLIVVNKQLNEKIETNAKAIDLVVGAKGSPLQLILCNIFHVDFPTGNIKLWEAERIAKNRLVKKAIPLALGDSYHQYRIIGTSHAYAELYDAALVQGTWWEKTMEVTIGSGVADELKLRVGDRFSSMHGLTQDGHAHEEQFFLVKGILGGTGTVIDNLILTSVESIWLVHDMHNEPEVNNTSTAAIASRLVPSVSAGDSAKELTSMLIQYRSAMGAVQLPRWINGQSNLQAASPPFETARLFSILGVGVDILKGFGYILIASSALSIFIALYNSLKERKYDLAIMRSMGASKKRIVFSVFTEGVILTFMGTILGLLIAHATLITSSIYMDQAQKAGINGIVFYEEEWIILAASLLTGLVCAIIPAVQAYRTDISKVLAGN
jgi:putative ABC transport system permease protein